MINDLGFGNPTKEYLLFLRSETYLDSLLSELKNYEPSKNDSEETQQELKVIIEACDNLYLDPQARDRYQEYDEKFEEYIVKVLSQKVPKQDIEDIVMQIHDDITPLLLKLKYHYERIRPKQLALHFNMPLYPYTSKSSDTPSYPSGHTFQAKVYCEVLGNRYPQYYNSLKRLSEDIAVSRVYMGVHYPSDIEFAKYCADVVLNHPDFKEKYRI